MSTSPTALTGENIRVEMARQRKSQITLATHLGLSQTAISSRLRGKTPFDINELVAVAAFLNVRLSALVTDTDSVKADVA